MTETDFEDLAMKVLMGEATAQEKSLLEDALARDANWRDRFAEIKEAHEFMRESRPLVDALNAPPQPVPEPQLARLRDAVRKERVERQETPAAKRPSQPPERSWLFYLILWFQQHALAAGSFAALLLLCLGYVFWSSISSKGPGARVAYLLSVQGEMKVSRGGKPLVPQAAMTLQERDEVALPAGSSARLLTRAGATQLQGPQKILAAKLGAKAMVPVAKPAAVLGIRSALFQPLRQFLGSMLLSATRSTEAITLYSPRGSTRSLTPVILWKAEPEKVCEISIYDELNNNRRIVSLTNATSPVDLSTVAPGQMAKLSPGNLYRLRLKETGNPLSASEYTFRTLNDATGLSLRTPAEKIEHAHQCLTSDPPTFGDALAALLTLPAEFADNELVLRLKLVAFAELGLAEEYNSTEARLKQMVPTSGR